MLTLRCACTADSFYDFWHFVNANSGVWDVGTWVCNWLGVRVGRGIARHQVTRATQATRARLVECFWRRATPCGQACYL